MSLEAARAVRALLAAETPPEGWPIVVTAGDPYLGAPVPKCSGLECPEPGIYHVQSTALAREFVTFSAYACPAHLPHFGRAAITWMEK